MANEPKLDWKRILLFGAHPDDEIIGAGGTLARFSAQGAHITVVTFTSGETGYTTADAKATIAATRAQEMAAVDPILGIHRRISLGKPTQAVVNDRETYQECVRIIREVQPDVILTHAHWDRHRDHRAISEITEEAWYKAAENIMTDKGVPWRTPELYYYEIFELFPLPSLLVDITETFDKKFAAMQTQTSQMAVLNDICDYVKALAATRGYQRGTPYAEAFGRSSFFPTFG